MNPKKWADDFSHDQRKELREVADADPAITTSELKQVCSIAMAVWAMVQVEDSLADAVGEFTP